MNHGGGVPTTENSSVTLRCELGDITFIFSFKEKFYKFGGPRFYVQFGIMLHSTADVCMPMSGS